MNHKRADAMAHFREVAGAALGSDHCYPGVQPIVGDTLVLPSLVYYAVGQDVLTTLERGPHQTATAIRFEARDRDFAAAVQLSTSVVEALRRAGRLAELLSLVDEYDEELNIHRRIRSVMVRG